MPPARPDHGPVRVTLIGRPGCHLCDTARETVEQVTAELGVGWEELSIDDDAQLREAWAEQVPVTLVDGRQHDYWRVDAARLRAALSTPSRDVPPAS
jgi:glutaredoxin